MIPQRIIEAKRSGAELTPAELEAFFGAYASGEVEEYQMAAFLMAVVFRGLAPAELEHLVRIMLESGAALDLSHLPSPRVDKHSTGGVGDKVSLVVAPLVAEAGLYVPMMSGRGLGHTGGTLDKLESIPGFRTDLSLDEFQAALEEVGVAMIGQTAEIAPLDRRLYALRSVTATVASIPLIAASIMSKKLAEGLSALVLDVKVGAGAFLPAESDALELARTMVEIGGAHGVETVALLTAMDRPLGRTAGNALEVREAIECLRGEGPADLRRVTLAIAGEMLKVGGIVMEEADGERVAEELLDGGAPLERFRRMIERQGGDARVVDDLARLPRARYVEEVTAGAGGLVAEVAPVPIGEAVVELGGGRTRLGQEIDAAVGVEWEVAPGDELREGDRIGRVHAASPGGAEVAARALGGAIRIVPPGSVETAEPRPLISHRITAEDLRG